MLAGMRRKMKSSTQMQNANPQAYQAMPQPMGQPGVQSPMWSNLQQFLFNQQQKQSNRGSMTNFFGKMLGR